jgi:hypothetical protein
MVPYVSQILAQAGTKVDETEAVFFTVQRRLGRLVAGITSAIQGKIGV